MNKIFRNSVMNILQVIIVTPIFFLLIPYTISKIGKEGYGMFALIGVISSYQAFVEMGFTNTLVKFVAQAKASGQNKAIGEYLSTTLAFFLAVTVVFYGLVHFSSHFIVTAILGIKSDTDLAVKLVKIAAITTFINVISGLFKSLLDGIQRMDLSNLILTIQVIISALGTVFVLQNDMGLNGLFLNAMVCSLFSLVANLFVSQYVVRYRLSLAFNWHRFKEMFDYSVNLQLSNILFFWIESMNKILITHFISLAFVGYYDIAVKTSNRITSLVRSGLSSIFPAAAEKYELEGSKGIENLRQRSLHYLFPLVTMLFLIGVLVTPLFIRLWLGPQFEMTIYAIIILFAGSWFSILATPLYTLLLGSGFSRDTLNIQWQTCLVNLAGIALFASLFGFYGFCAGYSISMFYGFLATNRIYRKRFGSEIRTYKIFLAPAVLWSSLLIAAGWLVFSFFIRDAGWLMLTAKVTLMGMIALFAVWKFRIFTMEDLEALTGRKLKFNFLR